MCNNFSLQLKFCDFNLNVNTDRQRQVGRQADRLTDTVDVICITIIVYLYIKHYLLWMI